ncbi:helix-turn-helix domain-containing protein [Brassicibacter mesophilus]|uniref:helix-turn-helix domain-containing protein n=1 Tax=Brassicibacter mesophilus TaxID=745119 RepID=UPI003D1DBD3E
MSSLCYKKLWKLLIDRNMKKCDLRKLADISQSTMAKLSKGQNVTTETLVRICIALDCELNDIADVIR